MAWAKNGTPDTLTGTSATLLISDLTKLLFNVILTNNIRSTLAPQDNIRLGSGSLDTGSNYANRRSRNGTADVADAGGTSFQYGTFIGTNVNSFGISYMFNLSTEEKLAISFYMLNAVAGSGTAPDRQETVSKWVNTSNQFDNVGIINTNTGVYAIDSNLSALGTD